MKVDGGDEVDRCYFAVTMPQEVLDTVKTPLQIRVERLEEAVAELEGMRAGKPGRKDWRATFGMSRNDAEFEEIVRLGREYRESLRKDDSDAGV